MLLCALLVPSSLFSVPLGNLGHGVTAREPEGVLPDTAYLLFSSQPLASNGRFTLWAGQATNFAVVYESDGQWNYFRNETIHPFDPSPHDVLVAEIDYLTSKTHPPVTLLQGENSLLEGIRYGYKSGDLGVLIRRWRNRTNKGEFTATGTEIILNTPVWWHEQEVINSNPPENRAPVSIGQAKNFVRSGLLALQQAGRDDLRQIIEDEVSLLMPAGEVYQPPPGANTAWYEKQQQILVTGQLKALAKPFYDAFQSSADLQDWISSEMVHYGNLNSGIYPWSDLIDDDQHLAPATIGQLKSCFAFDLRTIPNDLDGDGLSGLEEEQYDTSSFLADTDGDGLTDAEEVAGNSDPTEFDSDGDGIPDGLDYNPSIPEEEGFVADRLYVISPLR